jgi:outer membrane protein assembly factor BamB
MARMLGRLALLLLSVTSCKERSAPPGSGALETTPTTSASVRGPPIAVSPRQILSYPGGAILVLDPAACRVQAIAAGKQLWTRNIPACRGLLEVAIARDSTAYVRADRELAALEPGGAERWRVSLEGEEPPRAIASPTTLADSRAVLAESPRSIAVYDSDGRVAWRFSVPTEEALVAPPQGLPTEGVTLLTGVASYVLGAEGELRWRLPTSRK